MLAASTRRRVTAVLKKVFGVTALRPGQQAVIDAVLAGKHTLALMPTGAGKSLCYQVPAMLKPGRTVVVSPLIALMRDQFEKMSALGITAVQVNSAVSADEARRARAKIGRRTVEFVFTTPEQLTSPALRAMLSRAVVDLLVIDEAHCISQWGPRLPAGVRGSVGHNPRAWHTHHFGPDCDCPAGGDRRHHKAAEGRSAAHRKYRCASSQSVVFSAPGIE